MVRHILGDIIGGMRTPERPSSPIDAYITDEEIFNRLNPKVNLMVFLGDIIGGLRTPERPSSPIDAQWDMVQ